MAFKSSGRGPSFLQGPCSLALLGALHLPSCEKVTAHPQGPRVSIILKASVLPLRLKHFLCLRLLAHGFSFVTRVALCFLANDHSGVNGPCTVYWHCHPCSIRLSCLPACVTGTRRGQASEVIPKPCYLPLLHIFPVHGSSCRYTFAHWPVLSSGFKPGRWLRLLIGFILLSSVT